MELALSSYESYIVPFDSAAGTRLEWLSKLDIGNVKVKVAVSVTMIAAIHLLRAYLEDLPAAQLTVLSGVELVFVLFTLGLALVDRTARHADAAPHG